MSRAGDPRALSSRHPAAVDTVLISAGSYPRAEWYSFGSLSDVLSRYVEAGAEKYWERVTR